MAYPHRPFEYTAAPSPPTSRVTRASARLAAELATISSIESTPSQSPAVAAVPELPRQRDPVRKRKATHATEPGPADDTSSKRKSKKQKASEPEPTNAPPSQQRQKRQKHSHPDPDPSTMSGFDDGEPSRRSSASRRRQPSPPGTSAETSPQHLNPPHHSRRKSSRTKSSDKSKASASSSTSKRSKKSQKKNQPADDQEVQEKSEDLEALHEHDEVDDEKDGEDERSDEDARPPPDDPMDQDDLLTRQLRLSNMTGGGSSLSHTLRALGGMMSGVTGRLRSILENLRAKDDPSAQMMALTELSELLLISNEDNLAGHFSPDSFVKELVVLMQPNDYGEENPDMMLLACRCIANLMEAIPSASASVVYGGAVPVLCQKLLEIHYIDLAEQALSTLEKISVEFPASIVREGGLTACLAYLDFFATSTQRTAVTTAANCCRGIPEESFPVIKEVMPTLLNVLSSSDQKVVEQGSLCVCRIIESFKWQDSKLEELIGADLLKAILRLLLPGTTNLIGANIHTQFLRVLAIASRASPRISVELLRLQVVDTLYQILTGISPPSGTEEVASKIDKNVIMQALIRSPKDQVFETLNLICEILPAVSDDGLSYADDLQAAGFSGHIQNAPIATRSTTQPNHKRVKLLQEVSDEVRRFAVILFPTLMHAYTSTVNLNVRQKVLIAQMKMLSNFDTTIIEEALSGIPFASHIASLLTQQDNPLLITCALQIAEMLINRLGKVYKFQFHREGVIAEIKALAERPLPSDASQDKLAPLTAAATSDASEPQVHLPPLASVLLAVGHEPTPMDEDAEDHIMEDDEDDDVEDDDDRSESSSEALPQPQYSGTQTDGADHLITTRARKFMTAISSIKMGESAQEASATVDELRKLGNDLVSSFQRSDIIVGEGLFQRLAQYFAGLDGITSYELLKSDIVDSLLTVFSMDFGENSQEVYLAFLRAFTIPSKDVVVALGTESPTNAFSILLHKLQDLLSRTEHFEVITVHQNAFDSSRHSATSMLAKQLRLRLTADEDSRIPKAYRNIMVSIHAIATFRALDEYLRPRISLSEQPAEYLRARKAMLGSTLARLTSQLDSARDAAVKDRIAALAARAAPPADTPSHIASTEETPSAGLRRSSRHAASIAPADVATPRKQITNPELAEDSPLECADETKISDEDASPDAAMDTLMDHFEDDEDEEEDVSAVNMQVAKSGKVTAHKEDGTRIATPKQGAQNSASSAYPPPSRPFPPSEFLSAPSSSGRPTSYANAVQTTPQDWHIAFEIHGQPVNSDTTIYQAIHFNQSEPKEQSSRAIWSATHQITFKRVPGPPPAETSNGAQSPEAASGSTIPASLSQHPQTAGILQLMSILHHINAHVDDLLADDPSRFNMKPEPLTNFINTKLTAKLNRQLEEPLIVASNCLPNWSEDLARLYPFLFPFEIRHFFLQSTSFGYSRSMARWQSGQTENQSRRHRDERPFLGKTQRQKVRISRSRILESAIKVMESYGSSPSILEVEYYEEVGTGLGPTLEFYATISKELSKKKLQLWRENESDESGEYAFGKNGLFPAPLSAAQAEHENGKRILNLFRILGIFVARSMLDSRLIDISFNPAFFRIGETMSFAPSMAAVANVDKSLANSLKGLSTAAAAKRKIDADPNMSHDDRIKAYGDVRIKNARVEDLGLDFTLPGYPYIELEPNGAEKDVTIENLGEYIDRIIDMTLGSGVQRQAEAFRAGFSLVFPYSATRAFTPTELVMLFGHGQEDWSLETLMDSLKADHGFNLDSQTVRNLLQTMSEYDENERRDFLQFVTGSPKLPIGGFKSLTPMFTVVCKPSEPPLTPDDYLPSVMTCVNYLKMPDYTSIETLKAKLAVAIKEGQGAFHLS